jgi:glycosyltransferase involved in cell wall biosynthesis
LISFIGVLTHNVDYEKVINLAETRRDTRIYMIGDGPMRYHLIKIVEEKGLNNINVPGYLPDEEAYGILSRSQVCVFPLRSTFHTSVAMHMKILDYAALGKAIATDRDATARIFEEHDAALVSDPANPQEFIENVQRLIDDMELRRRLGRNARRLVKDFTWQKQGEKLTKLYENLEVQG